MNNSNMMIYEVKRDLLNISKNYQKEFNYPTQKSEKTLHNNKIYDIMYTSRKS